MHTQKNILNAKCCSYQLFPTYILIIYILGSRILCSACSTAFRCLSTTLHTIIALDNTAQLTLHGSRTFPVEVVYVHERTRNTYVCVRMCKLTVKLQ